MYAFSAEKFTIIMINSPLSASINKEIDSLWKSKLETEYWKAKMLYKRSISILFLTSELRLMFTLGLTLVCDFNIHEQSLIHRFLAESTKHSESKLT